jgi:hypothetical protein
MSFNNFVPLGNNTALNHEIYHGWMPPANVRGTSDIIYTCITTITLCVYTAIHPNIPHPDAKRQWRDRTAWVIVGIIAPEYVLWIAFTQFSEARQLVKVLNEEYIRHKDPSHANRNKQFSLAYGFFIAMGGLRFDFTYLDSIAERSQCLTVQGCMELARIGTFFHIDQDIIRRKREANALAKVVVCLEVLWMSIQCIARATSALPLTLMEIHTFAHVVCAIVIYGLWFQVRSKSRPMRDLTVSDEVTEAIRCVRGNLTYYPQR